MPDKLIGAEKSRDKLITVKLVCKSIILLTQEIWSAKNGVQYKGFATYSLGLSKLFDIQYSFFF